MKVVHIVGSISRKAGGLFHSVRRLAQEERALGCEVEVLAGRDEFTAKDIGRWAPLDPRIYEVRGLRAFGYSTGIKAALDELRPDILHLHGLWQYTSYAVSSWAKATDSKYIVSSRGMLDAWALRNSRWKKKWAERLYERRSLRSAACIHALTEKEVCDVRDYGVNSPVCIIPNGIDIPERDSGVRNQESDGAQDCRNLLYIGRLHPKKGLGNLLRAWRIAGQQSETAKSWRLVIAGWDDAGHEANLRKLVKELGLEGSVDLPGALYGPDKDALLRNAHGFVLPSLSEGLPMSVLEAWAYGLPVLMTKECNIPQGFSRKSAMEIGADSGGIALGLSRLFAMSVEERMAMGCKGKALVAEEFAWKKQAGSMLSVYDWCLNGNERSTCIVGKESINESR